MAGRSIDREKAKAQILECLRLATTRKVAYEYAGVDHATFYRWMNEDETFANDMRLAEASWQVQNLELIIQAAKRGSWQAAAWLQERHPLTKALWKRIDQHDISTLPVPRLLEMLAAAEEGAESAGDRAAGEAAELRALPE
jgi:predicted Zn-dependent protease